MNSFILPQRRAGNRFWTCNIPRFVAPLPVTNDQSQISAIYIFTFIQKLIISVEKVPKHAKITSWKVTLLPDAPRDTYKPHKLPCARRVAKCRMSKFNEVHLYNSIFDVLPLNFVLEIDVRDSSDRGWCVCFL